MTAATTGGNGSGDDPRVLAYRVTRLEEAHKEAVADIRDALRQIAQSLQTLKLIELQNVSTNQQIASVQIRMSAIEEELPSLKLARKWVLAVMTSGGAALGAGVLALVVK